MKNAFSLDDLFRKNLVLLEKVHCTRIEFYLQTNYKKGKLRKILDVDLIPVHCILE